MIEILEKIRALPEVSAFQFGFVKDGTPVEQYEWHAMLNRHEYGGAIEAEPDPADRIQRLLQGALESLEKGIADAKRFSEPG